MRVRSVVQAGGGQPGAPLTLRCFGRFEIRVHDREPDLGRVRPRVRALLRLLAVQVGDPVHRERLLDLLWPDLPPEAGVRNLQVAVSQLRALLEPDAARGASRLVLRDGESYLLPMSAGTSSDVREFDRAGQVGRRALAAGERAIARDAFGRALQHYTGELLPEDGPAEWVITDRERYRLEAAELAGLLAELELDDGRPDAAVTAARRSVAIDAFRDASWRVLVTASERAGNTLGAQRALHAYHDVLRSLHAPAAETRGPALLPAQGGRDRRGYPNPAGTARWSRPAS